MGTVAVILGFAWWAQVPVLGKADMVGLYLSRVAEANTWLFVSWFTIWFVTSVWLAQGAWNKGISKLDIACFVFGVLLLRFVSFATSKAMAVWWADLWLPFFAAAIVGLVLLVASLLLVVLFVIDMLDPPFEEVYEESYVPTKENEKGRRESLLILVAGFVLLYV